MPRTGGVIHCWYTNAFSFSIQQWNPSARAGGGGGGGGGGFGIIHIDDFEDEGLM
jgi:hypothetical protein